MNEYQRNKALFSEITGQMVAIPGGTITLHDDRTKRHWSVAIKPFLLGRFPVTQKLYREITHQSPCTFSGGRLPVETVSWNEAVAFCNALSALTGLNPCYSFHPETGVVVCNPDTGGFRLPSEAEWEYACRAGTTGPRYGDLEKIAWFKLNSGATTHPVGLKEPNQWGLYDMLGNVWEWCSDIYDETVYGSYRIFRGGGWNDVARGCLATNRRRSHPASFRIDDLGFRVAQNQ